MNDQIILNVTKRAGGLEVTTRGTGHDQLAAIEAVAASAWRVTPSFWCSAAGSSRPGRPRERRERNAQLLLRLLRSSP